MKDKIVKRILYLQEILKKWSNEYYNNNNSLVSDQVYDAHYQELLNLETKYPNLKSKNSITNLVGATSNALFSKVKHSFPMLSIANAFSFEDIIRFDNHIKNQLHFFDDIEYIIEYKIDGLSIAIIYENGKLVKAITRGDGWQGENVTQNILEITDIPKTIDYQKHLEIRGEIYISHSNFELINENLKIKFANPRNAASGTLRNLNQHIVKERKLSSFFYQIMEPEKHNLKTQIEVLNLLKKLNFQTNEHTKLVKNINEINVYLPTYINNRFKLDYSVDGLVVKVNNLILYDDIGQTAKYPKWLISYKFPEKIVETKLLNIFPTVGRTGRITYNAKLEPIKLAGTTVSFATLHNSDYIKDLNLNVGDIVKVKKAGEIIPQVIGLAKKNNIDIWTETLFCPSCSKKLFRNNPDINQYCLNKECKQRVISSFEHFVSKNAFNIVGISKSSIQRFYEVGILKDFADFFTLENHKETILNLERYGEKSINNLFKSIQDSKIIKLSNFIYSLGINHIGFKKSQILTSKLNTIEKIKIASYHEIVNIPTLGPSLAKSLINWFSDQKNLSLLDKFKKLNIKIKNENWLTSNLLTNLTFVITGTFSKPRTYYENLIVKNGGNISNSISKKTNYLLLGKNPGSKKQKALNLNINIINEKDLLQLIKNE